MQGDLTLTQIEILKAVFDKYPDVISFDYLSEILKAVNKEINTDKLNLSDDIKFLSKNHLIDVIGETNFNIKPHEFIVNYMVLTHTGLEYIICYNYVKRSQLGDKIDRMAQSIKALYDMIDEKIKYSELISNEPKISKWEEKKESNAQNKNKVFNFKTLQISAMILALIILFTIDMKIIDRIIK